MNSIWIDSVPKILDKSKSLDSNISCDVTIVGGGLTGLTSAYYLSKKGLKVVVLEKESLMLKTSGNTTAKITAQHDLFYKYLIDTFGAETAKKYLNCNLEAIDNIKKIIDDERINCDFEYQSSYVFTKSNSYVQDIKDEAKATHMFGFDSKLLTKIPLPINNVLCAIEFPNQAQFNPRKYALGLSNSILNNQGLIFENSKVTDVQKIKDIYYTKVGDYSVQSKYVILATRYPFINAPGFYFLKMYQTLSYCASFEIPDNLFSGMYINAEHPTLSARIAKDNGKDVLLLSGCSHKVGKPSGVSDPYSTLTTFAHSIYSDSKMISKWVTEDSVSLDKLPYIGQFSSLMPNMYVATGFKKWGMTFSNVASNILVDKILGNDNEYSDIFDSTRLHPIQNKEEMGNMIKEATTSIVIKKFTLPNDTIQSLALNEGKIIEFEGSKIGVYKNKDGDVFKVKPVCTHLGCELSWNPVNKTWDCPCHGSRFNYDGKLLYGPALHDLEVL